MFKRMKQKVKNISRGIMDFIHNYTLEIILMSFIGLGFCRGIGYFCNALLGMKFELASCWAGFSAIGGAGVLASIKYCMDSWKNTPEGQAPSQGLSASQRIAATGSEVLKEYAKGNNENKNEQS